MLEKYIKADIYRLLRMKALYILLIVAFVVQAGACYLVTRVNFGAVGYDNETFIEIAEDTSSSYESAAAGFTLGFNTNEELASRHLEKKDLLWGEGICFDTTSIEYYALNLQTGVIIFVNAVLFSLIIGNEYKFGFNMNIVKANGDRKYTVLSKFILAVIECASMFVVVFIYSFILELVYKGRLNFVFKVNYLAYFITEWFMILAITCIFICFCYLFRNKTIPMILSFIIAFDVHSIFFGYIDELLAASNALGSFRFSDYLLTELIGGTLYIDSPASVICRGLVLSIFYIIISVGLSVFIYCKRDVK